MIKIAKSHHGKCQLANFENSKNYGISLIINWIEKKIEIHIIIIKHKPNQFRKFKKHNNYNIY